MLVALPASNLVAQALSVTLGPEIDVGAFANNGEHQYQSNLRTDPTNPDRMTITLKNSSDEKSTAAFSTVDAGVNWSYKRQSGSSDPDVIFDQRGRDYWTVIDISNGNKPGVFLSDDGGLNWGNRITMSSKKIDHAHTAADRTPASSYYNTIYHAGRNYDTADLEVVHSRDQGATWQTNSRSLSGTAGKGFANQPWVMKNGTLIVPIKAQNNILTDSNGFYAGNKVNIYSVRSIDGGVTLEDPVFIANRDSPARGGAGSNAGRSDSGFVSGMWNGIERLYLAYPYTPGDRQPSEIRMCTSDDGGSSWSTPRVISPNPPNGKGYAVPSLMVNPDGVIGLQFFEIDSSLNFNVFFSASSDGGTTFSSPVRVSSATGKEIPFGQIPRELGGDQIFASAASDGSFRMVWTDNRDQDNRYRIYYRKVMVKPADPSGGNDAPVSVSLIGGDVNDGSPTGTIVGTFRTNDPDLNDTHVYTLLSGDTSYFEIIGNSLRLRKSPRFAIQKFFEVAIRSTDSDGLFVERTVQVGINPSSTRIDTGGYIKLGDDASAYTPENLPGAFTVSPEGRGATLTGNRWKKVPLSYNVAAGTVLEVTISGNDVGEITAIGLDNNTIHGDDLRAFKLAGSQSVSDFINFTPVYVAGSGAKKYVIPVGTHYIGNVTWLVMLVDDDADASANITFSEIRIHESGASGSTSLFQKWSASRNWGSIPTSLRNPSDDPDGDGKSNLLEMALGQNPATADSGERMRTASLRNPNTSSTISLFYPKFERGLTYRMEVSANLQSSSWSSVGVSQETFDTEQGMYRQSFTTPAGSPATSPAYGLVSSLSYFVRILPTILYIY